MFNDTIKENKTWTKEGDKIQEPIDYKKTPEGAKPKNPGKERCGCPFRVGHYCNDKCGLFASGLNSCVLHGINLNLSNVNKSLKVAGAQLELLNKKMPKKFSLNRTTQDDGKDGDWPGLINQLVKESWIN